MDYYNEIRVFPDPEFKETTLMNALYSKLHRALGHYAQGKIGVSFPNHEKTLGNLLRLHGSQADLNNMMEQNWLKGLRDYCLCTEILAVPSNTPYRLVSRVQTKSAHNLRKRSVSKGWLTEEEAIERIPDNTEKLPKLPYAQLRSLSNGNTMRVYIEHNALQDTPSQGSFGSFGLSRTATIPWF